MILEGFIGQSKGVAVFDWDNTVIFGDIGEAVFRYQVENLLFRLNPEEFQLLIPEEINGVRVLEGELEIRLSDIQQDILEDYNRIYPFIIGNDLSSVYKLLEYQDFTVKLILFYDLLKETPGLESRYAYEWVVGFLKGFSGDEVRSIAKRVFTKEVNKSIQTQMMVSADMGKLGPISHTIREGLRIQDEMLDLIQVMRNRGFDIYIITSSQEYIVQGLAESFRYGISNNHVLGIRLEEHDGVLSSYTINNKEYPIPFRHGKVEVIQKYLPSEPLFVAGDTNTDYEMLSRFSDTKLRLIINRNHEGEIKSLYERSYKDPQHYLLQGRDENTGKFRPHRETLLYIF